jgi:hypothetical protein
MVSMLMDADPFKLTDDELRAIAVAWDELTSYFETVGYESSLDDEEMPTEKIPDTIVRLRSILDRYAHAEHLLAAASSHHRVIEVEPVRFTYRPDTPPSGPVC